mmetsp:Transcript_13837/g.28548  ORF Transcript_13837/g.28548 Transcript_13837/m.28548 type:complete len:207 (-) Transcript_13837:285-905(-)
MGGRAWMVRRSIIAISICISGLTSFTSLFSPMKTNSRFTSSNLKHASSPGRTLHAICSSTSQSRRHAHTPNSSRNRFSAFIPSPPVAALPTRAMAVMFSHRISASLHLGDMHMPSSSSHPASPPSIGSSHAPAIVTIGSSPLPIAPPEPCMGGGGSKLSMQPGAERAARRPWPLRHSRSQGSSSGGVGKRGGVSMTMSIPPSPSSE